MKFALSTAIALMLSISAFGCLADQKIEKEQQLSRLKAKIEKIRKAIEVKENSKSSYNQQLRAIEKKIGLLDRQLRDTSRQIRARESELETLNKDKQQIQSSIRLQNDELAAQLHAAYTLGREERIKLLFSQQDPQVLQRNLTYYEYFSRYRIELIEAGRSSFEKLLKTENQISEAKQALVKARNEQRRQYAELDDDREQRKGIIARLDVELKKQGRHLSALEEDAEELKKLIDSLTDILTEIPDPPSSQQKFADLRGKLAWPAKGDVRNLYGKPKPPSNLRWQGVIVEAPQGNNVRAVSHGRVAFADWLRGMGNLVIIDHGQGYLSLYGHNQAIYKSAGEWVEAGDIIASIGNSGGHKTPGVYFEIRRQGKPQNPARWCKSANWFAT